MGVFSLFRPFWWVLGLKKCVETPKPYFPEDKLELSVCEKPGQTDTNCAKKGHFTWGWKLYFARISFKSTLYKIRFLHKLYVPGDTVTRFWVFLDIIEHAYLVIFGPFLTRPSSFWSVFFSPGERF